MIYVLYALSYKHMLQYIRTCHIFKICFYRYYEAYQLQQEIINLLENKQFSKEELQLITTLARTGLDNELKRYKDSHLISEDSMTGTCTSW